jgi:hypothetical protein
MINNISVKSTYSFDINLVRQDVEWILKKNNYISQIGLTHSTNVINEEDKILECTGSIFNYETNEFKFKETDFTEFNKAYSSTYLYEIWNTVPNIGRFRIMTMDGPKCYTIHRDLSKRYHYAVETNTKCMFLFPEMDRLAHIPCDQHMYLVDTRYNHTFINASRARRIHIVLDDLSSLISV